AGAPLDLRFPETDRPLDSAEIRVLGSGLRRDVLLTLKEEKDSATAMRKALIGWRRYLTADKSTDGTPQDVVRNRWIAFLRGSQPLMDAHGKLREAAAGLLMRTSSHEQAKVAVQNARAELDSKVRSTTGARIKAES